MRGLGLMVRGLGLMMWDLEFRVQFFFFSFFRAGFRARGSKFGTSALGFVVLN